MSAHLQFCLVSGLPTVTSHRSTSPYTNKDVLFLDITQGDESLCLTANGDEQKRALLELLRLAAETVEASLDEPRREVHEKWAQSCWNSVCRLYRQVQARTRTAAPLACRACDTQMNAVLGEPVATVAEVKVCRFCRSNRAASDLGCCDACYERRHPDFAQTDWRDDADQKWAEAAFRREVGGGW